MVAYALVIIDGGLHERFMTIVIGDAEIGLRSSEVRRFIRQVNEEGIDAALDRIRPGTLESRVVMRLVYEEFKNDA